MQRAIQAVIVFAFFLSGPLAAQPIVLEAEAGVEDLAFCGEYHVLATCQWKHVGDPAGISVGATVRFDDGAYFIEWMGPGYHLESGLILQPMGVSKPGLRGQRWLEVYPGQGRIHTSRDWKDVDRNRALSASDTLQLDSGPAVTVADVRLQLRVRPAPPEP
jgi:hypothetical protein